MPWCVLSQNAELLLQCAECLKRAGALDELWHYPYIKAFELTGLYSTRVRCRHCGFQFGDTGHRFQAHSVNQVDCVLH